MKKSIFISLFILLFAVTNTNLLSKKGDFLLRPSVKLNYLTSELSEDFGVGFGAELAGEYFTKTKLAYGGGISYNTFLPAEYKDSYTDYYDEIVNEHYEVSISDITIKGSLNYYFREPRKKTTVFIGVETGLVLFNATMTDLTEEKVTGDDSYTTSYYLLAPHIGMSFPMTKNTAINVKAGISLTFSQQREGSFGNYRNTSTMSNYNFYTLVMGYSYIF